jgi:hypothetical protein
MYNTWVEVHFDYARNSPVLVGTQIHTYMWKYLKRCNNGREQLDVHSSHAKCQSLSEAHAKCSEKQKWLEIENFQDRLCIVMVE